MGSKLPDGVGRGKDTYMVPVELIVIDEEENYTRSDRGNIDGLARSIMAEGMRDAVTCHKKSDGKYYLVDGYRRMKAIALINEMKDSEPIERVAVDLVGRYSNEADNAVTRLIKNAHREDATPLEKAKAYKALLDVHGLEVDDIARRLGEPKDFVKRTLELLQASQPIREALEQGKISVTAAAKIAKKHPDSAEKQKEQLDLAIQASGGKGRARVKDVAPRTHKRGPRQTTRTLDETKEAIEAVEGFKKSADKKEKLYTAWDMWNAVHGSVNWMLGAKEAPWIEKK